MEVEVEPEKELNQKEKLEINWSTIKEGKKIIAIYFIFKKVIEDKKSSSIKKSENF